MKSSNLLFPSVCFNVYHKPKFYRPCSKPPVSPFYCFRFYTTFISEQASEAKEVMLFLQANESVSRFPRLSPFFYPSSVSYFSLSLSYCSESENAPCINIQTVASTQRINILHETWITESHTNLRSRKVKSQEITIYNKNIKVFLIHSIDNIYFMITQNTKLSKVVIILSYLILSYLILYYREQSTSDI